ncbi:MAG: MBL fold metallo-hydrolase, partial [Limnohabitans sp.]|nr:MBL fold metallo-hydrolase [Limnohabitans sp.]
MNADDATRTALGISRRDAIAVGATAMLASFAVADSRRSTEPLSMDETQANQPSKPASPFTVVLGIAQDGGVPQAGSFGDARWNDPGQRRHVVSLGVVDPSSGKRWIIDATPDFPRQLLELHRISGGAARPAVDGIFLTHAHIGHYPGLMYLGKEAIGATKVPTYAMPRMRAFLEQNGPWSQLATLGNIALQSLVAGE